LLSSPFSGKQFQNLSKIEIIPLNNALVKYSLTTLSGKFSPGVYRIEASKPSIENEVRWPSFANK
jgi:hypothetical protein